MRNGLFCLLFCCQLVSAPYVIEPDLGGANGRNSFSGHRGNYPFVTDATWISFCDHVVSGDYVMFDPAYVKKGDAIYVDDLYHEWFLKIAHPQIKQQYILVSGSNYVPCCNDREKQVFYDPKVAAWFCPNLGIERHAKCFAIPCGPMQGQSASHKLLYARDGQRAKEENGYAVLHQKELISLTDFFLKISLAKCAKIEYPLAYFNEGTPTGSASPANSMVRQPFCCRSAQHVKTLLWAELAKYKFAIIPKEEGFGAAWEALAFDTIPVMLHSPADAIFEGTPVVLVHNWEEVTEDFLDEKYRQIQDGLKSGLLSKKKLFFDHWLDQIQQIQADIREDRWIESELEDSLFDSFFDGDRWNVLCSLLLEKQSADRHLLVIGEAMGLRPYQLAAQLDPFFCKVFVIDPYSFERNHKQEIQQYAADRNLLSGVEQKMEFKRLSNVPQIMHAEPGWHFSVFFDLSHSRYAFTKKLTTIYRYLPAETLICGNRADDLYVKEMLRLFSEQHPTASIKEQDGFWWFHKN